MALELNQTCYKNAGVCQTLHKITQPKLDSGLVSSKKVFRSVHPALVLFNKGIWNKNKRKQKQQRTGSPFSIKGATHLMILIMHINNHAKHIRTRQTNLPTSSRFPLVSWPCDPWCYTNRDRSGSACNFSGSCHIDSRSVCQILPGALHHDLWEVCHAGVLSRCPTATYGIGTKEGKSWEQIEHICCFPKIFPRVFRFFFQMFKVSHVFHHLFPSFSPFLSSMFSHFSPMKFTIPGEAKPGWNFPSSEMVSRLRFRLHDKISWITCCVLRKDPKGPKSVMWHILNHWTWLVT